MPKNKAKAPRPGKRPQKGGQGSANTFFETAEELGDRHPESKERVKGHQPKHPPSPPNPENPEHQG